MTIKATIDGKHKVLCWTDDIEDAAHAQLENLAGMPFIHGHVAIMPDAHHGLGCTIGSVVPTRGAIIPAAVGVDIGCGMNAVRLSINESDLPDSLAAIRSAIEATIPVGMGQHDQLQALPLHVTDGLTAILAKHPKLDGKQDGSAVEKTHRQIGTLGTGNHFIELCLDESQQVWIMLHSGSRGMGNRVGTYFIDLAKREMEKWFVTLPDKDLAYLPTGSVYFDDYIEAVHWAQDYALLNRATMMERVIAALAPFLPAFETTTEAINCHHNYVAIEHHFGADVYVTRKGAIRARQGDLGIIPGSMGTRSYIVRGKGNTASLNSSSHGAGRRMSRNAARAQFSLADLASQTAGVECRKDDAVIDEIPGAYKDIDVVMANQSDLTEVVHTLKQVLCVKG